MDNNDINNSIDGLTDEAVMELYDGIIEAGEADYLADVSRCYYTAGSTAGGATCCCSGKNQVRCVYSTGNSYYAYSGSCKY